MPAGATDSEEKIPFSAADEWDLIKIIAQQLSSRDPRVQVKELVDNALDAFSRKQYTPLNGKQVCVLIRKKDKRNPHIKVVDNGPGWEPHRAASDPGFQMPDFEYTVKHIGDSIKKKYAEFQKASDEGRLIGRYAIGLFGFWALGGRLTIYSRSLLEDGSVGPCSMMTWHKEVKDATIKHNVDAPPELSKRPGSVVIVDELQKTQMNLITGNILATYFSRACRTVLMKNADLELVVDDHGSKWFVKPKKYEGTKFKIARVETEGAFGYISMEIFANPPVDSIDEFQVPVFTKGAKAYNDITEIPELNVYPWNAKKVYGEINYPFGNLSPSRTAFVNDEWLGAFIKTMLGVTKQLGEFVDRLEAWKRAKQRSKFNQIFQETWQKIFKNLSPEWMQKGTGPNDKRPNPPPPPPPPIGPIYRVEVTPENARVAFRTVESLTARPYDKFGNIVRDSSLIYYWKLDERRLGQLTDDVKKTARFQAFNKEGITTLTVTVLQYIEDEGEEKTIKKTTATNIWVVKDLPPTPPPSPPSGDRPPNREESNLSEDGPHSKYDLEMKTVYINDHHSDYIKAKQNSEETLNRYINYCYATEIAVNRWKNLDPHDLSEKITELVSLAERTFDWKELLRKPKGRHRKEDENA
jgi:hypothetical protein